MEIKLHQLEKIVKIAKANNHDLINIIPSTGQVFSKKLGDGYLEEIYQI